MEEIVQMLQNQKLDDEQLLEVIKQCKKLLSKDLDFCEECREVGLNFIQDCDSYEKESETLCPDCAKYCGECDIHYGYNAEYKHRYCENNKAPKICEFKSDGFEDSERYIEEPLELEKQG